MQIDYKTFVNDLQQKAVCAARTCIDKADRPGYEDHQGYTDALVSIPSLIRYFFCKDRTTFDFELVAAYLKDKANASVFLACEYRYPWDQHLEFARARGYLAALRLLNEHAARTIHAVPMSELLAQKEVKVVWHLS